MVGSWNEQNVAEIINGKQSETATITTQTSNHSKALLSKTSESLQNYAIKLQKKSAVGF